jgi:ribose transport system substrate-binding protein
LHEGDDPLGLIEDLLKGTLVKTDIGKGLWVAALAAILAGCGSQAPPASAGTAQPATAPAGPGKAAKDITIGLSMYTLAAPYFAAQTDAVTRKAAALGVKRVIATEAHDDMNKQLADVEDLLSKNIDILILNPKDPDGLIPATKAATRAGVPVIIIDSSISSAADYVTTVQSNNMANGELVGEWIVSRMKGQPIRMALLSGTQGNPVGKERRQGVFRGIIEQQLRDNNKSGFEILTQGWGNWTHEGGLKAMEDMLVACPGANVLLCENDSMCLGALKAIGEAGRKNRLLVAAAADGQKEAYELIRKGEYGVTGLNDPDLVGGTATEIAVKYLAGQRAWPKISYTPPAAITKANVDKFYRADSKF